MGKEQIPIRTIKTTLVEIYKIQDVDIGKIYWGCNVEEMDMEELATAHMNLEIIKNMIVDRYFEFMKSQE